MKNIINLFKHIISKRYKEKEIFNSNGDIKLNHITVDNITPNQYYSRLSDSLWLSLLLNPKSLELPGFPPEDVQLRYTGRAGLSTMAQAYEFYI